MCWIASCICVAFISEDELNANKCCQGMQKTHCNHDAQAKVYLKATLDQLDWLDQSQSLTACQVKSVNRFVATPHLLWCVDGRQIKRKTNIKCLSMVFSHHVLPEQLQCALALIVEVSGTLLAGWNPCHPITVKAIVHDSHNSNTHQSSSIIQWSLVPYGWRHFNPGTDPSSEFVIII